MLSNELSLNTKVLFLNDKLFIRYLKVHAKCLSTCSIKIKIYKTSLWNKHELR